MNIFGGYYSVDQSWELRFHSKSNRTQRVSRKGLKPAKLVYDTSRRIILNSRDKKTGHGQRVLKFRSNLYNTFKLIS